MHTALYADDVDSSIREFSYIWAPGGFDLEYAQAVEGEISDNRGDRGEPQHQAKNLVSYPENPCTSDRPVG